MKILNVSIILFLVFASISCNSDDSPEVVNSECDLTKVNPRFQLITADLSSSEVTTVLESEPSQSSSIGDVSGFIWNFCENGQLFIEVKFLDGQLISKSKSFTNGICSENVDLNVFDSIENGTSVEQIIEVFGNGGDTYRVEYERDPELSITESRIWYSCTSIDKFIDVTFKDDLVIAKDQNF